MFNGNKAIFGPECDKRIIAKWKEYGGMELLRGQEYSRFEVDFFFTPEFLGNTPGAKVQRNSTPRSTAHGAFILFLALSLHSINQYSFPLTNT